MPALDYAIDDFRAEAVTRSAAILGQVAGATDADLTSAQFSVCVPAASNIGERRRIAARLLLAQFAITLGMLFCGVAMLFGAWSGAIHLAPGVRLACGVCGVIGVVIGWLAMTAAADIENALVRLLLRRFSAPVPGFSPTLKPKVVRIEDPSTYRQLKLVADDLGMLYCDTARRVIVVEGLFYRYVIHARDVRAVGLQETRSTRFVMLTFAVAGSDATLALAMSSNSAAEALKRRFDAASPPPLVGILQRTLGIAPALPEISVLPLPEL